MKIASIIITRSEAVLISDCVGEQLHAVRSSLEDGDFSDKNDRRGQQNYVRKCEVLLKKLETATWL